MRHGQGWAALVFLLMGLLLPGCQTPGGFLGTTLSTEGETRASRPKELPPEQTAELAQAAAEELEKQGHEVEAIAQYENARQHDPHRPVARRLAVLYDRVGDDQRALKEYDRAVQAAPRDAELLNDRGYFHYERGEWAEAEQWLRRALEVDPQQARATINLGLVLARQERYEESLATFQRVLPDAQARCNVGMVLAQQGKASAAWNALEAALQLDPHLTQARAVLGKLEMATNSASATSSDTSDSH
jgi:Tfp pilus assembly protein PilF